MMKRSLLFGIIIVLSNFISLGGLDYSRGVGPLHKPSPSESPGPDLLIGEDIRWEKACINAWAILKEPRLWGEEPENVAKVAKDSFNLITISKVELEENKDFKESEDINLEGYDKEGTFYDIIIKNEEPTHIVINITHSEPTLGLEPYIKKLEDYFEGLHAKPRITTNLVGNIQGELKAGQRSILVNKTIDRIKGRDLQVMEDKQLISIAGYSPRVDVSPVDGVNFQIASRYNEYTDKTYLWVGTPLITIEY